VLRVTQDADPYVRFVAVLVPLAESRFKSDAAQKKSRGIYQQTAPWWKTWDKGAAEQCQAFLDDFASKVRLHTGRPIPDAWQTQMWDAPDPHARRRTTTRSFRTLRTSSAPAGYRTTCPRRGSISCV
jgi:hypothetical protein